MTSSRNAVFLKYFQQKTAKAIKWAFPPYEGCYGDRYKNAFTIEIVGVDHDTATIYASVANTYQSASNPPPTNDSYVVMTRDFEREEILALLVVRAFPKLAENLIGNKTLAVYQEYLADEKDAEDVQPKDI
jgi:hypothetical protein